MRPIINLILTTVLLWFSVEVLSSAGHSIGLHKDNTIEILVHIGPLESVSSAKATDAPETEQQTERFRDSATNTVKPITLDEKAVTVDGAVIALIFDVSSTDQSVLDQIVQAVEQLTVQGPYLDKSTRKDWLAIYAPAFGGFQFVLPWTNDYNNVFNATYLYQNPGGLTSPLAQLLKHALADLDSASDANPESVTKSIIVFTDNVSQLSEEELNEIATNAKKVGVRIHVVRVGSEDGSNGTEELATLTGGILVNASDVELRAQQLAQVYSEATATLPSPPVVNVVDMIVDSDVRTSWVSLMALVMALVSLVVALIVLIRKPQIRQLASEMMTGTVKSVTQPFVLNRRSSQAGPARARLVVMEGMSSLASTILLHGSATRIGRDPALSNVVLEDPRVSRYHCRIAEEADGTYKIYDEGSTSGTYVNYAPVGLMGVLLRDQDVIHVGPVGLRFELLEKSSLPGQISSTSFERRTWGDPESAIDEIPDDDLDHTTPFRV